MSGWIILNMYLSLQFDSNGRSSQTKRSGYSVSDPVHVTDSRASLGLHFMLFLRDCATPEAWSTSLCLGPLREPAGRSARRLLHVRGDGYFSARIIIKSTGVAMIRLYFSRSGCGSNLLFHGIRNSAGRHCRADIIPDFFQQSPFFVCYYFASSSRQARTPGVTTHSALTPDVTCGVPHACKYIGRSYRVSAPPKSVGLYRKLHLSHSVSQSIPPTPSV